MITEAAIKTYESAFPNNACVLDAATESFCVVDDEGALHPIPWDEPASVFYNRIKRSKECGRNLFIEELPVFSYEENVIY